MNVSPYTLHDLFGPLFAMLHHHHHHHLYSLGGTKHQYSNNYNRS